MNATEVQLVITTLRNYYGSLPQPDWKDPRTSEVWLEELRVFSLGDGMAAVHSIRDRSQALLDAGKQVWFPTLVEVTNDLRNVASEAEREAYARDALTAAVRCDGSRWIDNAPNAIGVRPFPAKGDGLIACPTCSPSLHKRQMGGNQHEPTPRGEQVSAPHCHPEHDEFSGPTIVGRAEIGRAKAMVAASGSTVVADPQRRIFRSTRDLDEPEADVARQPSDRDLRCPWCGGTVSRTKMAGWWRCEIGEMSTMAQIVAGSGGGR